MTIGDVGYLDSDGFLYLSDRARDMVISGGVNIYPIEIESCLLELPGVRDVAVFGIPDDSYGEALAAHVDVDPDAGLTEDAIRDHVRERLAGYKVPKVVVFDDDLPREASGKLFKRRLRDRYWQDAGRAIWLPATPQALSASSGKGGSIISGTVRLKRGAGAAARRRRAR